MNVKVRLAFVLRLRIWLIKEVFPVPVGAVKKIGSSL